METFKSMEMFKTQIVIYVIWILLGLIIVKMGSYILAKKIVLKEKIEKKGLVFGGFALYLIIVFLAFHLLVPSGINKFLFNTFGNTDFSSKKLKVYLTESYNKTCGTVDYFHKFNSEELSCIENLTLGINFTTEDINKLTDLNTLEINDLTFDNFINLPKNNKLSTLKLNKTKINNLDTSNLGNIERIVLTKDDIDTINISDGNLSELYIENSNLVNLKVQGNVIKEINATETPIQTVEISNTTNLEEVRINKATVENVILDNNKGLENRKLGSYSDVSIDKINNLELKNVNNLDDLLLNASFIFKNIKFLENKGFHLENNNYLKLDNALYVPKGTKVKELILENLTAVVKDYYHDLIGCDDDGMCTYDSEEKVKVQGQESTLGDHIEIYNNDVKIFEWSVSDYEDEI